MKLSIWIALILIARPAPAQITELDAETEPLSCLAFVEAGGQGISSLNVEKYFSRRFGVRVGIGPLFPVMFNYYIGTEKMLELGVGAAYAPYVFPMPFVTKEKSVILSITIGHKYQPKFGGLTLRYSFTPMVNVTSGKFLPMFGLSFGFAFR